MSKRKPFILARSFRKNNERRFELINKKYKIEGLTEVEKQTLEAFTDIEEQELEALQEWVKDWVNGRHPTEDII